MELIVLLLIGAVAWLWNRVGKLERRIAWLDEVIETGTRAMRDLREEVLAPDRAVDMRPPVTRPAETPRTEPKAPTAAPAPATGPASVPKVARAPGAAFDPSPAPEPQPEPEQEPQPEAAPLPASARWRPSFDFEEIFGRLLPIWGGGIALAIAGFFFVRWSIENGLLDETVRVVLSFGFGALLLAAAEIAHRFSERLADPRVRQALAGAGLAALYASFYLAGSHYGLIGGAFAFAGLAAVTALAIGLSYRFGLPSAVLGLLGGFAAPALAGASEPNLPLLATYLALVTGGLVYTGRKQERSWLGLAALAGGLGWGALMLVADPTDEAGILAFGGYLVLVGTLLPTLMGSGVLGRIGRIAACALATLQIAALVDQSGYSMLAWGAYVLLAMAIAVLGWSHDRLREAGAIAAALAVCLIAAWPSPTPMQLAVISAAMAAIFAGGSLAHVAKDRAAPVDWGQLAAFPVALGIALCVQLAIPVPGGQHTLLALASLALAIPPAIGAWLRWPSTDTRFAEGSLAALASAASMLTLAGLLATPGWAAPLVTALVAGLLFALLLRREDSRGTLLVWGIALVGAALHVGTAGWDEFEGLVDGAGAWTWQRESLRALAAGVPFALLALRRQQRFGRRIAQVLAVLFGYGALTQTVPASWLPLVISAATLALAFRMRWRAAHAAALALSVAWALPGIVLWAADGVAALAGEPMLVMPGDDLQRVMRSTLPLIAAWAGSLLLSRRFFPEWKEAGWAIAGAFALVLVHVLYKTLFSIATLERFVILGLAERTVWEGAFALVPLTVFFLPPRLARQNSAAVVLAGVSLAHFAVFTLLLHNPLWADQAVGALPLANLLLPAYLVPLALLVALRQRLSGNATGMRPMLDAVMMVLIALLALSELRQAYSGSLLTAVPMTQQEDLLRSILAIALALAYLGWGAWKGQRSWRIGSLVLMLMAVTKVFLFDAAGLEGLARIASFMALGLCLIGIGWFYTRQLKGDAARSAV